MSADTFYGQAYVLPDGRILVRSAAEIKAAGVLLPKGTIVCDLVPEDVNEAVHEELDRLRATQADAPEAGQEAAAVQAVGAWQPSTWQEQEARYEQEMSEAHALEKAAQAIYEQWSGLPGYVPWVDGGNSDRQEDARRLARAALSGSLGDGGGKG